MNPTETRVQNTRPRHHVISKEFFNRPAVKSSATSGSFERCKIGDRVGHSTFGAGTVLSAREMGTDVLYEIAFDDVGTKKLMATFAKLHRVTEEV